MSDLIIGGIIGFVLGEAFVFLLIYFMSGRASTDYFEDIEDSEIDNDVY